MRRSSILLSVAALALGSVAAVGAWRPSSVNADRADCPGKIVCPLTGELVCRDKCTARDPNRPDCPGRIKCPQTGELVCVDRCPVKPAAGEIPSCCSKAQKN